MPGFWGGAALFPVATKGLVKSLLQDTCCVHGGWYLVRRKHRALSCSFQNLCPWLAPSISLGRCSALCLGCSLTKDGLDALVAFSICRYHAPPNKSCLRQFLPGSIMALIHSCIPLRCQTISVAAYTPEGLFTLLLKEVGARKGSEKGGIEFQDCSLLFSFNCCLFP